MDEAAETYIKASTFAEKYLGPHNTLTKNMKEAAKSVKERMEKEKLKKLERQTKSSLIRTRSAINSVPYSSRK